jgi:hypothetical protein
MIQFAGVILVKQDGSVLCQLVNNEAQSWGVMGGMWKIGDNDLRCTATRVLREKTGYQIESDSLHYLAKNTYTCDKQSFKDRTIYWMLCNRNQTINIGDGQDIKFIYPDEFTHLNFYEGHDVFLRTAAEVAFRGGIERK